MNLYSRRVRRMRREKRRKAEGEKEASREECGDGQEEQE